MFNKVREAFENAGFETRSYSGRSMYGKECLGIKCDSAIEAIFETITEAIIRDTDHVQTIALIDELRDYHIDSLGLGSILYFPNLEWENENFEDETIKENE